MDIWRIGRIICLVLAVGYLFWDYESRGYEASDSIEIEDFDSFTETGVWDPDHPGYMDIEARIRELSLDPGFFDNWGWAL